ncbi:MAG TPA: M13 family metallopeptidase [Bryobacteraceae bacterium]|nr:M13 family metallopeptidase [Bryobacteraceae bacterium]
MKRIWFVIALLTAATGAAEAEPLKSGIDTAAIDTTCKPCDDFWRYANGAWLDKNPIPAARSSWGTLSILTEANRERLRVILEGAAAAKAAPGTNERKLGDLYGACMDVPRRDAQGVKPVAGALEAIGKVKNRQELAALLLDFLKKDESVPFGLRGAPDLKDTARVVAYFGIGGTSLPEREFYFRDDERSKKIREEFVAHVNRMLALGGVKAGDDAGQLILTFETENARVMKTIVERRDPYARYNKMTLAELNALSPSFSWTPVLRILNVAADTPIIVGEPATVKQFEKQLQEAPISTWKIWMQWQVLKESSGLLSAAVEKEAFRFDDQVLNGIQEQLPQWQRCANLADRTLGDALGEVFVKKHFPPAAKKRMDELVENVRATLREELENASWMDAETRKNAVAKLNSFRSKIGYPEKWRDYSRVTVQRNDLFESVRSAGLAARAYQLGKIGKPVDNNDWSMTPPTVNAYYSPPKNEIAFPAGILQQPLFDMDADDAANYGAIGSVIGHEMGHGFDDQGSKFDFSGNLKNWWTPEDRKKFEGRAQCVIDQFNTMDVGDKLRHNGKLVVGEALGDLGGVTIALKAYRRSLRGKPEAGTIDGFTPEQRFFLAFARLWGTDYRPANLRMRLQTDPHPLARFRANGTLMNIPEFQQAFQCKLGDPMVRPENERCKLW